MLDECGYRLVQFSCYPRVVCHGLIIHAEHNLDVGKTLNGAIEHIAQMHIGLGLLCQCLEVLTISHIQRGDPHSHQLREQRVEVGLLFRSRYFLLGSILQCDSDEAILGDTCAIERIPIERRQIVDDKTGILYQYRCVKLSSRAK